MDANAVTTVITGVLGAAGGFFGGRRTATESAVTTATNVVTLLQAQVETLGQQGVEKNTEMANLRARIDVLESLVLQRADVESVHTEVQAVKGVVDKIALKVGA